MGWLQGTRTHTCLYALLKTFNLRTMCMCVRVVHHRNVEQINTFPGVSGTVGALSQLSSGTVLAVILHEM